MHIRVTGLPAGLDRGLREVVVPSIGLAIDRLGIDLHQMHRGCAAPTGELFNFGRILPFLGKQGMIFSENRFPLFRIMP